RRHHISEWNARGERHAEVQIARAVRRAILRAEKRRAFAKPARVALSVGKEFDSHRGVRLSLKSAEDVDRGAGRQGVGEHGKILRVVRPAVGIVEIIWGRTVAADVDAQTGVAGN